MAGVGEVVWRWGGAWVHQRKNAPLDKVLRNWLKMAKGEKRKLSPLIDSDVGEVQEIWVINGKTVMLICFLPICIH